MEKMNYLIMGSGVAGLTFALKIANRFPERKITIITKGDEDESNTKYAQGGVAIVTSEITDSYQNHIEDTLLAGGGMCDLPVVEMVIKNGPKRLQELISWGADFDKAQNGNLDLGKEGGHSANRVVHHKDQTGFEIERKILKQIHLQENIEMLSHHFAIDLLIQDNQCFGAKVFHVKTKETIDFLSDYTILATGGIGNTYQHTSNPEIATGDGIAMAKRAGANISDMEFIQFHPTVFYEKESKNKFLISEAVRGFGAHLKNKSGERFLFKTDSRGELASRDIVSQAIDLEIKNSGAECVYLDCTHLDMNALKNHFPTIFQTCLSKGVNPERDWIPVVPAQHYLCGGVNVNTNGQTSIKRLLACGEVSRTGLHGANRLASNSLLEALVYADNIYKHLAEIEIVSLDYPLKKESENQQAIDSFTTGNEIQMQDLKSELQALMSSSVGIVRNDSDLMIAKNRMTEWKSILEKTIQTHSINWKMLELLNQIEVGLLIIEHSLKRQENCGGFMKMNY
jgi:L-aspartate oxidase